MQVNDAEIREKDDDDRQIVGIKKGEKRRRHLATTTTNNVLVLLRLNFQCWHTTFAAADARLLKIATALETLMDVCRGCSLSRFVYLLRINKTSFLPSSSSTRKFSENSSLPFHRLLPIHSPAQWRIEEYDKKKLFIE
jgi:hypothetical protein